MQKNGRLAAMATTARFLACLPPRSTGATGLTKAHKAEVVELVRKSGRSIGAIAKELDLTETAFRAWVRQAEVDAGDCGRRAGRGGFKRSGLGAYLTGREPAIRMSTNLLALCCQSGLADM
jgi:transposase-like protein